MKLQEGHVFTGVCLSMGVGIFGPMFFPGGGYLVPGPFWRLVWLWGYVGGGGVPIWTCDTIGHGWQADGTFPTRMRSCF